MKKIILISVVLLNIQVSAQNRNSYTDCQLAINQLSNYASQVNNIYQYEFWQGIPNFRCPSCCDVWGGFFNPQVVQYCRNQHTINLNYWYSQQINFIQTQYKIILQYCTNNDKEKINIYDEDINEEDQNEEIDVQIIDNTKVYTGKDVKIIIPDTPPAAFK